MEIIRLIFLYLGGAALMFIVQPTFFSSGTIPLTDVDTQEWIPSQYTFAALLLFVACLVATLSWYGVAAHYSNLDRKPEIQWFFYIWAAFSIIPFASLVMALMLFQHKDALPWLGLLFFPFDAGILFWFATAISTPGALKWGIVPGSYFLRHLPCLK